MVGKLGGTEVAVLQGRSHPYESGNAAAMRLYDKVAERSGFVQYRKLLG